MLCQDLLYKGAEQTPDAVALHWIDRDKKLTYAEAAGEMERAAGALAALGVGRGDRVGIFAHNGMDYVVAIFGAWRLGAVGSPVNVQWADRLDDYINDANPKVLIYTHDKYEAIERCRPHMPAVKHYICMDGAQPGALDWTQLLIGAPMPPPDPTQDSDAAYIWYKPGTTAVPIRATLVHEVAVDATHSIAERLQLHSTDVTLGPTTLSNSFYLVANLLPGLHCGATVGIMTRWKPHIGWQVMEDLGVTVLVANPSHLQDVLDVSREMGRPPSKLRVGLSDDNPISPALRLGWQDELRVQLVKSPGQSG